MTTPPRLSDVQWITLGMVVDYLQKTMGITRTRQTIYNWAIKGVYRGLGKRITLRTKMRANRIYTTRAWVKDFVEETSRTQ